MKLLVSVLIFLSYFSLTGQSTFNTNCKTDFFTITADGHIQQWSLNNGTITGGDTLLSNGGMSLSYCGDSLSPIFYTENWNQNEIGIDYHDPDSGWVNIPTTHHVQDLGGHFSHQYSTTVGGVIQHVNYWNGINLMVIDSLPGEFFAGIFDIAVDTMGQAWVTTASTPGVAIDSLKVYSKNGKVKSYSFNSVIQGYGSFFLNDILYFGSNKDSIYPVLISGNTAQLGSGISFPSNNFTDMASCQRALKTISITELKETRVSLFPNPTEDYIVLPNEVEELNVYNSIGQLIDIKQNDNILNLSKQPSGVYYIRFYLDDQRYYSSVIKK